MSVDETSQCRCCSSLTTPLGSGELLARKVRYFDCPACGYVQTEKPYWLAEAYREVINASDTGILMRNLVNSRIALSTLLVLGKLNGRLVDCAGGYGILVRLLRDHGVDAYWTDPYSQNQMARGFEFTSGTADLVTAFEAFEHFERPAEELEQMLRIAPNALISTELIATPAPTPGDWWYYGMEHGQHIGFFRISTLQKLAERFGKQFITNGTSYHLFCERPISTPLWKISLRFNKLISVFARHSLISKTWTDHELLAKTRKPCE